jgi:hypothetical protein
MLEVMCGSPDLADGAQEATGPHRPESLRNIDLEAM